MKIPTARKYVLSIAVIGLTLISVTAGYDFYSSLFGITTAILCCVIFETLRVICIYSFSFGWISRVAAAPLYLVLAAICAGAGITNFHAKIIESHRRAIKPFEMALTKNVELIKKAYAKQASAELKALDAKIDVCQRKLAWSPGSSYWQNRLAQLLTKRQQMVTERDEFLKQTPHKNQQVWLTEQAALLAVTLEPMQEVGGHAKAIIQALDDLWGLKELRAKKVVSFTIIVSVEFTILFLSLIAGRFEGKLVESRPLIHKVLAGLQSQYDKSQVQRFLEKCFSSLTKHGRMPLASELGRGQREMKKLIVSENIGKPEMEQMLGELKTKN